MAEHSIDVLELQVAPIEPRPNSLDIVLPPAIATKLAVFNGLKEAQINKPAGGMVLRYYKEGDVVCRQGDAGHSAFYILEPNDVAAIKADLPDHPALRDSKPPASGEQNRDVLSVYMADRLGREAGSESRLKSAFWGLLAGMAKPDPHAKGDEQVEVGREVARLCEGELFGEMACFNRQPRSATILAIQPTFVVEMLRNILRAVDQSGTNVELREKLKSKYEERSLYSHITKSPLLKGIEDELGRDGIMEAIKRHRFKLVELKPDDVIMKEGDESDCLWLISLGQVKVTKKAPGGEEIIAYRWRGDSLGEIGLLTGAKRGATCIAHGNPMRAKRPKPERTERTQLIKIGIETYRWLKGDEEPAGWPKLSAGWHESFRAGLSAAAERYKRSDERRPVSDDEWSRLSRSDQYHELGLAQGQKLMLIDLDRCTRCDECARACAQTHHDGRSRLIREGERFGHYLVPATCRLCQDPVCLLDCPVSSIFKLEAGNILITDWCVGCKKCAELCPYDAINIHERGKDKEGKRQFDIAVACDQCNSLSDHEPSCVYACPHDAAMRINGLQFMTIESGGQRVAGQPHAH